jgi:hypothetical protein
MNIFSQYLNDLKAFENQNTCENKNRLEMSEDVLCLNDVLIEWREICGISVDKKTMLDFIKFYAENGRIIPDWRDIDAATRKDIFIIYLAGVRSGKDRLGIVADIQEKYIQEII